MRFVFVPHQSAITKAVGPGTVWSGRMAAKLRNKLQVPLRNALVSLRGAISMSALERAILSGDRKRVIEISQVNKVGSIVGDFGEPLAEAVQEGGRLAMADLRRTVTALDMGSPRIKGWLRDHGAELVKQVNGTSRDAVRAILREGYRLGRHPRYMAQDIRSVVGLTERQSIAVARRQAAMIEAGVSEADIERRLRRYSERLLRQRAETIARNETMVAINRGRYELWVQLEADGGLEPGAMREWMTSEDERVCPICGPMNEQPTSLKDPYLLPDGNTVQHPPAHVSCRCTERII